jgi:hypothetical protein
MGLGSFGISSFRAAALVRRSLSDDWILLSEDIVFSTKFSTARTSSWGKWEGKLLYLGAERFCNF